MSDKLSWQNIQAFDNSSPKNPFANIFINQDVKSVNIPETTIKESINTAQNLTLNLDNPLINNLSTDCPNLTELTINNLPAKVHLRFWADSNGYFFWLQNSANENNRYYFPSSLKTINVNGQSLNVEAQKINVNEGMMRAAGGFGDFTKATSAINYFTRMSRLSDNVLAIEQKTLFDSAQTSDNPYFKIYLSDVDVALALKPIINEVLTTGSANLKNPQTLQYLNSAISLLQKAETESIGSLKPYGELPPQNTNLPLDPYGIYNGIAGSPYYYGFWGGSLNQARCREVALTFLRNLIQVNALPPIELPPALPPG